MLLEAQLSLELNGNCAVVHIGWLIGEHFPPGVVHLIRESSKFSNPRQMLHIIHILGTLPESSVEPIPLAVRLSRRGHEGTYCGLRTADFGGLRADSESLKDESAISRLVICGLRAQQRRVE